MDIPVKFSSNGGSIPVKLGQGYPPRVAGYKPYPITLTQSGNKWTADHTYAEVREALSQGYSPYCIYKNFHIPCTGG